MLVAGGGVVGLATGGVFFAHEASAVANTIAATTIPGCRICIMCLLAPLTAALKGCATGSEFAPPMHSPDASRAARSGPGHVVTRLTRAFVLMASFAPIQARAEPMALSGPQASGVPTRIAEQNRRI